MLGKLSYIISAHTAPLKQDLNEAKTAMQQADKQMTKSGKTIVDESKKMSSTAGSAIAPMEQGLSAINPAAGQAVQGMKSASMGAKALNAALGPIGLAVAAIGTAVAALTAYFKGSAEGQQQLAKIMAYLGGVINTLKDAFIDLGKWIMTAIRSPRDALEQLTNRFQGFVGMVTAGWKVISQGAKGVALAIAGIFSKEKREQSKEAFAEMKQGMDDFGKSAKIAWEGVKNIGKAISERAKETMALQERENNLRMQDIKNLTKIARLDAEIAAARLIANDEARSLTEQMAAQEQAMELVNQKFAIQERSAREALAIQRDRMALGHDTIEDMEQEARMAADLIGLERSRDAEAKNLLRRYGTIQNQREAEHLAAMKAISDEKAAREEALQAEMQARSNIMEEIRQAGLTDVEKLQEELQAKLSLYDWSESERLRITEHYQDQINAIIEKGTDKHLESFDAIGEGLADMQQGLIDIGVAFGESAAQGKKAARAMIDQLFAQVVAILIKKIIASVPWPFNLAVAAGAGAMAKSLWSQVPKMAGGGVIPPGYPNDTYPALLSSGETVVPPGELQAGNVRFIIEGDKLVGILDSHNKKNIYF